MLNWNSSNRQDRRPRHRRWWSMVLLVKAKGHRVYLKINSMTECNIRWRLINHVYINGPNSRARERGVVVIRLARCSVHQVWVRRIGKARETIPTTTGRILNPTIQRTAIKEETSTHTVTTIKERPPSSLIHWLTSLTTLTDHHRLSRVNYGTGNHRYPTLRMIPMSRRVRSPSGPRVHHRRWTISMPVEWKGRGTLVFSLQSPLWYSSAFSNPQMLHHMQRQQQQQQQQQSNRSQWQPSLHDQQNFQPSMNDWGKPQQYRGTAKPPSSLNHPPPPPHASFGGYRPYM